MNRSLGNCRVFYVFNKMPRTNLTIEIDNPGGGRSDIRQGIAARYSRNTNHATAGITVIAGNFHTTVTNHPNNTRCLPKVSRGAALSN
jgi:hypothetical protein